MTTTRHVSKLGPPGRPRSKVNGVLIRPTVPPDLYRRMKKFMVRNNYRLQDVVTEALELFLQGAK